MWKWLLRKLRRRKRDLVFEDPVLGAGRFVEYASREHGAALDGSPRSLEQVERILNELSRGYAQMTPGVRNQIVREASAYLLEVGRKEFGGDYRYFAPANDLALVVEGPGFSAAMLGRRKVEKRLAGDPADNIPFHYEGFQDAVRGQRSETCV